VKQALQRHQKHGLIEHAGGAALAALLALVLTGSISITR